jgi:hypothetical protein
VESTVLTESVLLTKLSTIGTGLGVRLTAFDDGRGHSFSLEWNGVVSLLELHLDKEVILLDKVSDGDLGTILMPVTLSEVGLNYSGQLSTVHDDVIPNTTFMTDVGVLVGDLALLVPVSYRRRESAVVQNGHTILLAHVLGGVYRAASTFKGYSVGRSAFFLMRRAM